MNSKRQVTQPRPQGGKSPGNEVASNGEIWSRGKNSRLPIDANVMLNLSFQLSIKRRGPVISPGYYEPGPRLLSPENRKKNNTKEIRICFISRLLVVFTWQLEILATQLCKKTHGVQDHVLV